MQHAQGRQAQRDRVRYRECGDGDKQAPGRFHDHHQRQHKKQVIETEQDVPDADGDVGHCHFIGPGTGPGGKARLARQDALELHAAIQTLQPHQDVDARFGQTREQDRFAIQATGNHDAPTLAHGAGGEGAAPGALLSDTGRKHRMDFQRGVFVQRRRFPQDVIGIGAGLGQLQVCRAELIGLGRQRERQQHEREQSEGAAHHLAGASAFSPSITTSYSLSRRA